MNSFEFIASLVESLIWPATIFTLFLLIKEPLIQLLTRVSHLKYKGLEADFLQTLNHLKASTTETANEAATNAQDVPTVTLRDLADISPRTAILEAWIKIETATRDLFESAGFPRRKFYQGLERLPDEKKEQIKHVLGPYTELRVLRNKAVHSSEVELTPKIAHEYIDVTSWVERVIRGARR